MSEKKEYEIKIECTLRIKADDIEVAEDEVHAAMRALPNIECVEFYMPSCTRIPSDL